MLMDLFIETLTGVSFELRVSPAETVMSIKSKIQRAEGIPVTQQHLIWQNGELDDHRRLRDYSISGGSTIRLVLGLCGGPLNAHRIPPPLRLAPLHIPASSSSVLSRLRRNASTKHDLIHPPGFTSSSSRPLNFWPKSISSMVRSELLVDSPRITEMPPTADVENKKNCVQNSSDTPLEVSTPVALTTCCTFAELKTSSATNSIPGSSSVDASSTHGLSAPCSDENAESRATQPDTSKLPFSVDSQTRSCEAVLIGPGASGPPVHDSSTSETTSTDVTPPLGYPPLFPDGPPHVFKNRHDLSSFWRLYEPQTLSTLSKALLVRNSYQLVGASDHENDPTPPGSAGERETRFLSTLGTDDSGKTADANDDGEVPFSDSTPSAASATTLLAGLLSTTGDRLEIPCQTSGGERFFAQDRPFYHGFRKTTPFLEDLEFARRNRIAALFWNPDDLTSDNDLAFGNPFDVDTEREDDDPDEDDNGSVTTKGGYAFDVDDEDDDSLADLEDYMLYYRTGDLLFGPPSLATIYPSYPYYTVCDTYPPEIEADFGLYTTHSVKDEPIPSQSGLPWHQERAKMAEKVNELKSKMNELRIRRQSRQRSTTTGTAGADPDPITPNVEGHNDGNRSPSSVPCHRSSSQLPQDSSNDDDKLKAEPDPSQQQIGLSKPDNGQRPRRRRYGTVTPPQPGLLSQLGPSRTDRANRLSVLADAVQCTHPSPAPMPLAPVSSCPLLRRPASCASRPNGNVILESEHPTEQSPPTRRIDSKTFANWPFTLFNRPLTFLGPTGRRDRPRTSDVIHGIASKELRKTNATSQIPATIVESNTSADVLPVKCGQNRTVLPPLSCTPRSPPKQTRSPTNSAKRKRCALCLRKIGIVNSYPCRCGRNFCSRHRYAETHSCPFDYKAEARRALIEANPIVTAPKLPKI